MNEFLRLKQKFVLFRFSIKILGIILFLLPFLDLISMLQSSKSMFLKATHQNESFSFVKNPESGGVKGLVRG